jgi:hypothetical protein
MQNQNRIAGHGRAARANARSGARSANPRSRNTAAIALAAAAAATLTPVEGHFSNALAGPPAALPQSTTVGILDDGKPDYLYDPNTGDVRFSLDGFPQNAGDGTPTYLVDFILQSGSGLFVISNVSPIFQAGIGATITPNFLGSAVADGAGFADGFDLGQILPPGLDAATLAGDLTLKFSNLQLRAADLVVGAPWQRNTCMGSGNWSTGGNWSLGRAPLPGDHVLIGLSNRGAATLTIDASVNAPSLSEITVDANGATSSILTLQGGSVGADTTIVGFKGQGTLIQTGGTHVVGSRLMVGQGQTASGVYVLQGGSLSVNRNEIIGYWGAGRFDQTGGTNLITNNTWNDGQGLYIGYSLGANGTYNLSGTGSLIVHARELIGVGYGKGTFNQSGGTHIVLGSDTVHNPDYSDFNISSGGAYNLSDGLLSVAASEQLGGVFNQSGGTHVVGGNLWAYTYNLSGGVLQAGPLTVGGSFTHTGGTLNANVTNQGLFSVSGSGTRVINGAFLNSQAVTYTNPAGTVSVSSTIAQFNGSFTNSAAYISDRSDNYFSDLNVTESGYFQADPASRFFVGGNYASTSTQNTAFNVGSAELHFTSGAAHTYNVTGTAPDFTNVIIDPGATVSVVPGSRPLPSSIVNNGNLAYTSGAAVSFQSLTGSGNLTVGGSATNTTITINNLSQSGATLNDKGTLILQPPAPLATQSLTSLTINPGGKLDLTTAALALNYGSNATPLPSIQHWLASAYNNGSWNGTGLTTSLAATNPDKYALGYIDGGAASAAPAPAIANAPTPGQLLIVPTLTGDANLDGTVDFFDITQLLSSKYNTGQPATYTEGDLNYDGVVDFFDITTLLSANYNTGETFPTAAASYAAAVQAAPAIQSVPEPSSFSLMVVAGLSPLLLRRGRGHRGAPERDNLT